MKTLLKPLLIKILIAPVIFFGSLFHSQPLPSPAPIQPTVSLGDTTSPFNGTTFFLSGSGVTSSATSITLSSFTIPQSGYKIADLDNIGTTFYMTLEPGSRTRQEIVSCTAHTQNAAGTATLSGCTRGLSPFSPYAASSTIRFAHPGGSQVIYGTSAQLFAQYAALANTNAFTGTNSFTVVPTVGTGCTVISSNSSLCDKAYIDGVAVAGASNANETTKGIVELATAIEQASSTALGSTAAALATQAKYATSSPSRGCDGTSVIGALCSLIAQNDGKINVNFFGTSSAYTYNHGDANVFNASTTFAATASNKVSFNTVAYVFPSTQGAASTTVVNNGSGTLSWARPDFSLIASSTVTSAVATTTLTIPSTLGADLMIVVDVPSVSGLTGLYMQFNADTGANYSFSTASSTSEFHTNSTSVMVLSGGADPTGSYYNIRVSKLPGSVTRVFWNGFRGSGTAMGTVYTGGGVYNSATALSSVSIGAGTAGVTLGVGTRIAVYSSTN